MEIAELAVIVGRILLGGLFLVGGLGHFRALDHITPAIAARGIPSPRLVLILGSVYQSLFGFLLMTGLFVALSALALVVFTVLASLMLVNFWDKEGSERQMLFNVFMSNLAIIGGLLIAAASAA